MRLLRALKVKTMRKTENAAEDFTHAASVFEAGQ